MSDAPLTTENAAATSTVPPRSLDPRSIRARESVLNATVDLLDEVGVTGTTIDAISARSGVSKMTIYRHWPNKTAVAAEAFGHRLAHAIPIPETSDPLADIRAHVRQVSAFYATENGTVFRQLHPAGTTEPAAAPYFNQFFLDIRRDLVAQLWKRAVLANQVRAGIDSDTAGDALFGALIYRLMSGHKALSEAEADRISDAVLEGLRIR